MMLHHKKNLQDSSLNADETWMLTETGVSTSYSSFHDRIGQGRIDMCHARCMCMHAKWGTGEDERPRRRRGWRAVHLTGNRYCCRPIARQRTRSIAAHAKALPRRVCRPLPATIYFQVICWPASLLYLLPRCPGPAARSQSQALPSLDGGIRQWRRSSHQPSTSVAKPMRPDLLQCLFWSEFTLLQYSVSTRNLQLPTPLPRAMSRLIRVIANHIWLIDGSQHVETRTLWSLL